jgi:hypothetical protein
MSPGKDDSNIYQVGNKDKFTDDKPRFQTKKLQKFRTYQHKLVLLNNFLYLPYMLFS